MKRTLTIIAATLAFTTFASQPESPATIPVENNLSTQDRTHFTVAEFDGFRFDLPEGCITETGKNTFMAKYSDGSFGVSMMRTDAKASDQKRATAVVQGLAKTMHLPLSSVRQTTVNGMKGAIVTGDMEGKQVTAAVIVHKGRELQIVAMSDPSHTDWTRQLFKTLDRK